MTQEELAVKINKWFCFLSDGKIKQESHFWKRNPVAFAIQDNLMKIGHWKHLGRGNPKKAFLVMKEKQNQKQKNTVKCA